jgi:ABC-type lipoprotein export system ATPase subunit
VISLLDVTKSYVNGRGGIVAVDRVSVQVNRGEFVIVFGRSGAGKSTLLAIMGGLLRPSSGRVLLDSESVCEMDERARARLRARKIGFVLQSAPVIHSLTVLENVLLPAAFVPRRLGTLSPSRGQAAAGARERAHSLLARVGLGGRETAYPSQLSGGETRRVAIASALMNDPPLILADEPTGELDPETESRILTLFAELNRDGTSIVMVTHNRDLASHADRTFAMDAGALRELCRPQTGDPDDQAR